MLSEKKLDELKEYIFLKQKEFYKRKLVPLKKRSGTARRESNKMLYRSFVLIDE